jgi:hypothetical protein
MKPPTVSDAPARRCRGPARRFHRDNFSSASPEASAHMPHHRGVCFGAVRAGGQPSSAATPSGPSPRAETGRSLWHRRIDPKVRTLATRRAAATPTPTGGHRPFAADGTFMKGGGHRPFDTARQYRPHRAGRRPFATVRADVPVGRSDDATLGPREAKSLGLPVISTTAQRSVRLPNRGRRAIIIYVCIPPRRRDGFFTWF